MEGKQVADKALDLLEQSLLGILANPEAAPEHVTIIPIAKMLGGKDGLTPSRIALFIEIRSHGPYGQLQELAHAVGRDKHVVSKDVDILAAHHLVHKRKTGRTITIEADARPILLS
jgi:hypothetical protein